MGLILAVAFAVAPLAMDARGAGCEGWDKTNERIDWENRCEGIKKLPVNTPSLDLRSFYIGENMVPFPQPPEDANARLKVRFFLPALKAGTAQETACLQAQEIRANKGYVMQAKQKQWSSGQWQEFFPWPLRDVLTREGITDTKLGLVIQCDEPCNEDPKCIIPALPYFSDRPKCVTSYTFYFTSVAELDQVSFSLFSDDAEKKPLKEQPRIPGGPFSPGLPFRLHLGGVETIHAGPVRLQVTGKPRGGGKDIERTYRFYHTPEIR